MSKPFNLDLVHFSDAEQQMLLSRLKAIRATVPHAGEKGRSLEVDIRSLVRMTLPATFGVATGFIAYHSRDCVIETPYSKAGPTATRFDYIASKDHVCVSPQMDVLVYDAIRFTPIVNLGDVVVLPAEAVIAYVEVKMQLSMSGSVKVDNSAAKILSQSKLIRTYNTRLMECSVPGSRTKAAVVPYPRGALPSIRSFVVALEVSGKSLPADAVARKLTKVNKHIGGFLSGLFIANCGYFSSVFRDNPSDPGETDVVARDTRSPLAAFKNSLLSGAARYGTYPGWMTPAVHRYFSNEAENTLPTLYHPDQYPHVGVLIDKSEPDLEGTKNGLAE